MYLLQKEKEKKTLSEVGFEPTPTYVDQNALRTRIASKDFVLESGALDHSATLTARWLGHKFWFINQHKHAR